VTVSLMIGVLLLVGLFRTSSALASAYGIAVATTMVVDGILAFVVIWRGWQWPLWKTLLLIAPFVVVDVVFFSANLLKLFEGAWAPLLFGATMVLLILTWRRGTGILINKTRRTEVPLDTLFRSLEKKPPHFVPGTAVFLTSDPEFAPTALLHNLKHNKVLHERVVLMNVRTEDIPHVPEERRIEISHLEHNFHIVKLDYGFMDEPNIPRALAQCRVLQFRFNLMETSFFLRREKIVAAQRAPFARWRKQLFIVMANTMLNATEFFRIPTNRVIELGGQIEI
jgi:KUP system potassium uptake protein